MGAERQRGGFPTTRWSLLARAGDENAEARRAALEVLLAAYLPALRTHLVRARRCTAEEADDVLQSFVAERILARSLVSRAAPSAGRFRSYVLKALENHLRTERGRSALRREQPTTEHTEEPSAEASPTELFERAWAREVIDETLRRMQAECEERGLRQHWLVFEARIVGPALRGEPAPGYGDLQNSIGFASPREGTNLLVTAKRAFQRHLRDVVALYSDDAEVDSEIRELRAALEGGGA